MAAPKRTDFERARDLAIVADLYLRAHTQQEIADHLNREFYSDRPITQQQIGYDVRVLTTRWLKSADRKIDERKAEELARVDRLEREYWDAWERSQRNAESTVLEQMLGESTWSKTQSRSEGQTGDPRFLAGVGWCVQKRCEILGLDAPKKQEHTGRGGGPIEQVAITLEEWRRSREQRREQAAQAALLIDDEGTDA